MINPSLQRLEEVAGVRNRDGKPISNIGNSTFKGPKYERCGYIAEGSSEDQMYSVREST